MRTPNWQPTLTGELILLRPLAEADFEALHAVASDPLVWEQHPERDRYKRENFMRFFRTGIDSKGAFVVLERKTGQIIGSSRFTAHDPAKSSVEVGYTFIGRDYWRKGYNRELKSLMLNHAFQFVDTVYFFVGETNFRSQKAITGIGATEINRVATQQLDGQTRISVVYQIAKADWTIRAPL